MSRHWMLDNNDDDENGVQFISRWFIDRTNRGKERKGKGRRGGKGKGRHGWQGGGELWKEGKVKWGMEEGIIEFEMIWYDIIWDCMTRRQCSTLYQQPVH